MLEDYDSATGSVNSDEGYELLQDLSRNTPEEIATYDERCAQIAREMLYAMSVAAR